MSYVYIKVANGQIWMCTIVLSECAKKLSIKACVKYVHKSECVENCNCTWYSILVLS